MADQVSSTDIMATACKPTVSAYFRMMSLLISVLTFEVPLGYISHNKPFGESTDLSFSKLIFKFVFRSYKRLGMIKSTFHLS